jgi:hypothetical protein
LPTEKSKGLFGLQSNKRNSSIGKPPPKLDSSALKKLNEIESSPYRQSENQGIIAHMKNKFGSEKDNDNLSQSGMSQNGGPNSINRIGNKMMNMFSSSKKKEGKNGIDQ